MKPHQQPLKSIPNIRSQYYVAAATLSVSAKINKAKSTLIDDKFKDRSYFQYMNVKPTASNQKRVNVSLDQQRLEEPPQLPPLRKEMLRSRQSQPVVQKLKKPPSPLLPADQLPHIEASKVSGKNVGIVAAYAANTHQGLVRQYNEDRVSIILNLMRPENYREGYWPQSSFFAVYDGHGGAQCADFMRDNLHQFIIRMDAFPTNPKLAIEKGILRAEKAFLELADSKVLDKSGCCAVLALVVDSVCYVANVGDSRAIYSQNGKARTLTVDHKPSNLEEQSRIIKNGGEIYQTQIPQMNGESLLGPHRVMPGRLAVSRTLGDAEAKLIKYGGLPNVISAEPDIFTLAVTDQEFLILACDGVFDKLTSEEVVHCAWTVQAPNVHLFAGRAVEAILRLSMQRKTFDNVTAVLIAFPQLDKRLRKA